MYKNPLEAYAKIKRMTSSPREIEAEALTVANRKFQKCLDNWNASERPKALKEALMFNQKLWTLFQTALAARENPLPKELRLNILKLGKFIDSRTFQILAKPTLDKLEAIMDINTRLAETLRKKVVSGVKPD